MVQAFLKFGGGEQGGEDRRFLAFEDKTIDEQADEITNQLIWEEEAPIFNFDQKDRDERHKFMKELTVAVMTIGGIWIADVKVLNTTKWGIALGPLRKFALINVMTAPVYWYFYTTVMQSHQDLKKHLVTRYLISDGQILFKRKF